MNNYAPGKLPTLAVDSEDVIRAEDVEVNSDNLQKADLNGNKPHRSVLKNKLSFKNLHIFVSY